MDYVVNSSLSRVVINQVNDIKINIQENADKSIQIAKNSFSLLAGFGMLAAGGNNPKHKKVQPIFSAILTGSNIGTYVLLYKVLGASKENFFLVSGAVLGVAITTPMNFGYMYAKVVKVLNK
jgi:hypothetical protein